MQKRFLFAIAGCSAVSSVASAAPISITSPSFSYSETFDGATSINGTIQAGSTASPGAANQFDNDSDLPGWYAAQTAGGTPFALRSTGGGNSGSIYNYGASNTDNERALGSVAASSTGTLLYGARLVNNSGATLNSFRLTYDGEQWHSGSGNTAASTLTPQYQIFNAGTGAIDTGTWTTLTSATFTSPDVTGIGGALTGNAAGFRAAGLTSTAAIALLPSQELWVRWVDVDDTGSDHGLAVDNVVIAIPEPTLLGLAVAAIPLLRRRRGQ